ncbi:hypothetical protein R3P38DRAFT_3586031 [Favolaschia claudopus]|uniref:Uncharacterized protein n=1 Tax=Favolaschia claudopus TaxID=2862362 RepID=A0AAW0ALA6_9AGAR
MTNRGRLPALYEWIYSVMRSSYTIPVILALYGLVLVYLLVSVKRLEDTEPSESSTQRRKTRLVPYYNSRGQLQGLVREEKTHQNMPTTSRTQRKQTHSLPMPTPAAAPAESDLAPAPVHQRTPPPLPQGTASAPPRLVDEAPLSTFPLPSWDGFPDGRLRCHFTPQQLEDTSQLAIYWVGDRLPGKQGSPTAATAEKGKVSRFQCAGVVECESKVCLTQIAPGANISRQRSKIAQYRNPNYKIPKAILPQDAATNSDNERMIDPDAD